MGTPVPLPSVMRSPTALMTKVASMTRREILLAGGLQRMNQNLKRERTLLSNSLTNMSRYRVTILMGRQRPGKTLLISGVFCWELKPSKKRNSIRKEKKFPDSHRCKDIFSVTLLGG